MSKLKSGLIVIVVLASMTLLSQATEVGQPFPEFAFKDIQGRSVSLSQFRGKVLLLDFWMTTCPPCKQEMPVFQKLQRKYEKSGLVVVGISMDDNVDVIKKFIKAIGVNYKVVMQPTIMMIDSEAQRFGIVGLPTTYIIDRDGIVRSKIIGFEDELGFENVLQRLLPEAAKK